MGGLDTVHIVFVIVRSLSTITNLICNAATLGAFIKVQTLRQKPSNLLILCLACTDLGIGLVQICQFPLAVQRWPFGKPGCQFAHWLASTCISAGLTTTAMISIDRYLLVSREYPKYLLIQTKKRIKCIIGGVWLYGLILGTTEVALWDTLQAGMQDYFDYSRNCRSPPKVHGLFATLQFTLGGFCPVFIVELFSVAFFVRLIRKLRRQKISAIDNVTSTSGIAGNSSSSVPMEVRKQPAVAPQPRSNPNKRYKKAAIALGSIVAVMNICTMPFVLYAVVTGFCIECKNFNVRHGLVYLVYLNSSINPFLYAATMTAIRKFYARIFCKGPVT